LQLICEGYRFSSAANSFTCIIKRNSAT